MASSEQAAQARILIVDDQKLHSAFLEKALTQEGYQSIRSVNDPLQVAAVLPEYRPDMIVLDLIMPQMDGFQILEQLHDFRKDHYLPVLALSEEQGADVRLRALQAGATDFLNKPYENSEILFRIGNMVEMRFLHLQVQNQNKVLEMKVRERTRELQDTQLEIIRRLAQAAEFRDNDTGLHIIRMSHYCEKFGESLGLDKEQCDLILHASPLHDVGKIAIPDSILLKPGRLTPEEFATMKTHTTLGGQLLSGSESPVMKMAREIALTHHEKWNGNGYPNGLKEDQIPFVGQLCSVCDVFDALTSVRPYKKAWSAEEAAAEITNQKGQSFNPQLADRFLEILPKIIEIQKKYSD